MDEQFIKVLYTALGGLGVQSKEQFEQALQMLGEDGISLIYQQYQKNPKDVESLASLSAQILQQKQQTQMARMGAQLNYINTLRGKCPEGYEVEKFLAGGCVKCQKKNSGGIANFEKPKPRFEYLERMKQDKGQDVIKPSRIKMDKLKDFKNQDNKNQNNKKYQDTLPSNKSKEKRSKMMAKKGSSLKCQNGGDLSIPQHVLDFSKKQKILKNMPKPAPKKELNSQPENPNGYRIIPIPNPNGYRAMPMPNYVPVNPEYVPIYTI